MVIIVFGVSGAGKTTIGELLARELGWHFNEADDSHSQANVEKMRAGVPLTDEDRWPWLDRLRELINRCLETGENAVLACSTLKRAYRKHLRVSEEVKFVFLHGDYELIAKRLRSRRGHFMSPALLQSQFDDLEEPGPPDDVTRVEIGQTPPELVEEIKRRLHLARTGPK